MNENSDLPRTIQIIFLLLFITPNLQAQESYLLPARIINGDTIPIITLPEFKVEAKMSVKMRRWYKKNQRLIHNIKVTMPYAKLAAAKLKVIDRQMAKISDEKYRKQYYKQQEQLIIKEFEKDIRKLTFSQGRILIKLIDRETGRTSYTIIQEYRSGLTAAFWQSLAKIFGYNLKTAYDPKEEVEIETIIKMLGYD